MSTNRLFNVLTVFVVVMMLAVTTGAAAAAGSTEASGTGALACSPAGAVAAPTGQARYVAFKDRQAEGTQAMSAQLTEQPCDTLALLAVGIPVNRDRYLAFKAQQIEQAEEGGLW